MPQTSTQLDMIAYLYGESTPDQTRSIESAIVADPVVRGELADLAMAQAALPIVRFSASRRILLAIRKYAASGNRYQLLH